MSLNYLDTLIDELRRTEFPATQNGIFLAASGGSPLCRSAVNASVAVLEEMGQLGDTQFPKYIFGMNETRTKIAEYLGASSKEIAFMPNSSSSATVMARLLKRAGITHIFYPTGEFPTSTHALKNAGFTMQPIGKEMLDDTPDDWLLEIESSLDNLPGDVVHTAAVVISHVNFLSGTRVDLTKISAFCRKQKLRLVVNATQSFGALPIEVDGIDMLFGTGLKWAAAGFGTGFLYIDQPLINAVGLPLHTGWLSIENPGPMDNTKSTPIPCAKSLDMGGGAPPFQNILALGGALNVISEIGNGDIRSGVSRIENRVLALSENLFKRLSKLQLEFIGPKSSKRLSGTLSIVHPDAMRIHKALCAQKIYTSLRNHPVTREATVLRFGVNYFVTPQEISDTVSKLESLM